MLTNLAEAKNAGEAEAMRLQAVDDAVKQGYILTRYFYTSLLAFEKDPAGLRSSYSDMLNNIDIKAQQKAASEVQFARLSAPEFAHNETPNASLSRRSCPKHSP